MPARPCASCTKRTQKPRQRFEGRQRQPWRLERSFALAFNRTRQKVGPKDAFGRAADIATQHERWRSTISATALGRVAVFCAGRGGAVDPAGQRRGTRSRARQPGPTRHHDGGARDCCDLHGRARWPRPRADADGFRKDATKAARRNVSSESNRDGRLETLESNRVSVPGDPEERTLGVAPGQITAAADIGQILGHALGNARANAMVQSSRAQGFGCTVQ